MAPPVSRNVINKRLAPSFGPLLLDEDAAKCMQLLHEMFHIALIKEANNKAGIRNKENMSVQDIRTSTDKVLRKFSLRYRQSIKSRKNIGSFSSSQSGGSSSGQSGSQTDRNIPRQRESGSGRGSKSRLKSSTSGPESQESESELDNIVFA